MFDIYTAHKKLLKKEISSEELVKECLKNTKKNNSYISILEDQALKQAKQKQTPPSTYLDGIPYSLKDLFITKNIRTTGASRYLANYIPPYDGFISESLQKAGGILIGKVSCDEFGMGSVNENTPFGEVLNPLNNSFVPGGSSGGSASSIAEKSSFFSIGTDTGGSIRLPANFCGLVGFKPTYGRISRYGQLAFSSSLDQASPMGQNVLDIACILENITGKDHRDSTSANLPPMKIVDELLKINPKYIQNKTIGFSEDFLNACHPLVQKQLKEALKTFETLGAKLVEVNLQHLKFGPSCYYIIACAEASANLARYDGIHYGYRENISGLDETYKKSRSFALGEEVKRRIILGTVFLASEYYDLYYLKAAKLRRLIYEDFQKAFTQCDFIFSPVFSDTALKRGEIINDPIKMYYNDLFTIPVNLAGICSLAIPFKTAKNDMPTGFQLIANSFKDEDVLKFGYAFESHFNRYGE